MKKINVIELNELMKKEKSIYILDVRGVSEFEFANLGGVNIPLLQISEFIGRESRDKKIYCLCHHGVRSAMACSFLMEHGYNNVINIEGGIDAWTLSIDSKVPRY